MLTQAQIREIANRAVEAKVDPWAVRECLPGDVLGRIIKRDVPIEQFILDLTKLTELPKERLETYRATLDTLLANQPGPKPKTQPQVDVSRLLRYAPDELIGREAETELLEEAWIQAGQGTRVLSLVALGGEGKTALVAKWLDHLGAQGWPSAQAVFAWSFYSQGSQGQSAASADLFINAALIFFGEKDTANSPLPADQKARRLLERLRARRTLLVLDGLEPLQYPPIPLLRPRAGSSRTARCRRCSRASPPRAPASACSPPATP